MVDIGNRQKRKENYGHSDANEILHVVYGPKRGSVGLLDPHVPFHPGSGVPHTRKVVSHAPQDLQHGHVLFSWIIQNRLFGLQCQLEILKE